MTDAEVMREVKALIRWYEKRGKNWLFAAEFTLVKHSGMLEFILRPQWPWKRAGRPIK